MKNLQIVFVLTISIFAAEFIGSANVSAASIADCIGAKRARELQKLLSEIQPLSDKASLMKEYVRSSRALSEKLQQVSDCKKDSSYLADRLGTCDEYVEAYNAQVHIHNDIQRRRETAAKLEKTVQEIRQVLALPRCEVEP